MVSASPKLGYNHNIPHRGRLYHVQTEDSGRDRAHIFTHVFYDGTIIASNKVEYADKVGITDLDVVVVGLMQESHKTMIRRLRGGAFDEKILGLLGEHPQGLDESNRPAGTGASPSEEEPRPVRRPPPELREVAALGPPLTEDPTQAGSEPTLSHPIYASAGARAEAAAPPRGTSNNDTTSRSSRPRRRAVGGIGGRGVPAGEPPSLAVRRDVIVGKFASAHQAELDEEILALLRDES